MCFPVGCAGTVNGLKPTPQGHHCFHSKKMPTDLWINNPFRNHSLSPPDINIYTTQKPECSAHNLPLRFPRVELRSPSHATSLWYFSFYQGIWNRVYPMILCRHIPPSHHSQTWLMGKLTGPPLYLRVKTPWCPVDSQEKATHWRPPCGRLVPWAVNWSSTSRA